MTLDVDLARDRVFATLIDVAALPGCNAVIEQPAELTPGRRVAAGARIEVTWTLRPATMMRRLMMAPMRARMLRSEVTASLVALSEVAALADRGEGARG